MASEFRSQKQTVLPIMCQKLECVHVKESLSGCKILTDIWYILCGHVTDFRIFYLVTQQG